MIDNDIQDGHRVHPNAQAPGRRPVSSSTIAVVVGALILGAAVAWRARYGISFFDDGHYASITLRLAQGARPFTDEMTAQTLGFLVPALFARAWRAVFGMWGFVLALRLLYVAFAAVVGAGVYRAMRPSYPPLASFLAASVPLIALPYNIIGLSYNTMALLGFFLSWAFMFRAARDGDRRYAVAAGVAATVGAISYPPLVLGALALLGTCLALRATRTLVLPALLGAVVTSALFAAWLLSVTSVGDMRAALAYSARVLSEVGSGGRVAADWDKFTAVLKSRWLLPMWVCAAVACVPWLGRRTARAAALLVPLAAFGLTAATFAFESLTRIPPFGILGAAYVIVLACGLLAPVAVWTFREGSAQVRLGMALALPLALVNTLATAYFTSASLAWAVPVIGLAPLVAVLLAGWFEMWAAEHTRLVVATIVGVFVLGGLLGQLYATAFKDGPPVTLDRRLTAPAVAGIITQDEMATRVDELTRADRRWSGPGDGVLFVAGQLGYVLVDGRMVTNAVWLALGPSDAETLAYFERAGERPDVAFVAAGLLTPLEDDPGALAGDPLLSYLEARYDRVDETGGFVVYRAR